jgi:predicted ATPase
MLALRVNPNLSDFDNLKSGLHEKKLLLVIDNFEHLLDLAEQLAELLTAVPGLRIIVTSQALLHLYGEHEYPLAPLPLPDSKLLPLPAELLNFAAVHLFVDRLQAVQPQFQLTAENSQDVIEICRCLDGMPLALELAAARGKLFTPAAMLAQLSQRLRFLTSKARNRASRHQTLRATIDWSYSLLTTAEQTLFAGTAVFAGPFTAEAAQAIFGENSVHQSGAAPHYIPAEDIPDLLNSLADRNMLRALPIESVESQSFRMLQTLREYGLEKMAQMENVAYYNQCYVEYYVNFSERGNSGLQSAEQSVWIQKLKREGSNLVVALDWLLAHQDVGQNKVLFAQMVKSLARFWILEGWVREIIQWLEKARSCLPYLQLSLQVELLNEYGNAMQVSGNYTSAENTHREALKIARESGEELLIAHTLHFLAYDAGWQGHYDEAKALFLECLPIYRQIPEVTTIQLTRLLNNLAIVHKRLGEYEESIKILQESLDLKREIDDELGLPASLANLGNLLILQGKADAAADLIYEALERRRNIQDRQGILYSINQMAGLAVALGQYGRAATLYAAADAAHQQMALSRATDSALDKQRNMEIIHQHLEPDALAERLAVGAGLSLDEVCEFALPKN